MAKEKKETVRFYRGKLPTIVWDARNNCALCDLSDGHIITSDEYTIEVMRKVGYTEVELDATSPPDIVEPIQSEGMADVRSLPKGLTEKGAAKLQSKEDHDGPAVPAPTPKAKPAKKAVKARNIKRRTKTKK